MPTLVDIFLSSKELKRTIVKISIDHEIPLKYLAKDIGVEYNAFMKSYINSLTNDGFDISEGQVERLFKLLGIEVRTQFVLKSDHKFKEIQELLKEKHGFREYWLEQKKGVGAAAKGVDNFLD